MTLATRSLNQIESITKALLAKHDVVDASGRVDVHRIVADLGGEVQVQFDTGDRAESLQVRADDDFTVLIPWNTSAARDRFTIAHELGHLVLHYDRELPERSFYRHGQGGTEAEANAFAGALLMPEAAFTGAWEQHEGDLSALADQFGVSKSAVGVRAKVLRLT